MTGWQTRSSRTVYENRWIRVREDKVIRPDGSDGIYGVVEVQHPAVFIVALTESDEVVLVRLRRYTLAEESLEVPAGGTDGEDPLDAARRELREETGYAASDWTGLGLMHSLDGVSKAPAYVFLARGLAAADTPHQMAEEGITEVLTLPWPDVLGRVRRGEIHDAESVAALMYAALELGRVG